MQTPRADKPKLHDLVPDERRGRRRIPAVRGAGEQLRDPEGRSGDRPGLLASAVCANRSPDNYYHYKYYATGPGSYATGHPGLDASDGVGLDRSRTSAGVGGEHPAAAVAGQLGFGQREQRARRLGSALPDSPGGSEQLHVIVFLRSGSEFKLEWV